jgi:hypothetical protein
MNWREYVGIEPDLPPHGGSTILKTAGATRQPDTPEYEPQKIRPGFATFKMFSGPNVY